jgi:hypothetical protein
MITERLLQFIWQFQYFNNGQLKTFADESLQVFYPGMYNTNQGPDFLHARIRINDTIWIGNIELHVRSSDWEKHRHDGDPNYGNVILHVVWEHDLPDHHIQPVLELDERIPNMLLQRYEEMMNNAGFIACEKTVHAVPELNWLKWKERLLAERLSRKAKDIESSVSASNHHWEEIFWWGLARNFGMKVNMDAFEGIAKSLPLSILGKHKNQIHQLEALLLGQAGLLSGKFEDHYALMLFKEYSFLQKKYKLRPVHIRPQLLRMRPGNFPTVRLAQLAMLIHDSAHLFTKIREAGSLEEVKKYFDVTANDYWNDHYLFDETSSFKPKRLGSSMIESIVINTIAPMLFAYGNSSGEQHYKEKAVDWLNNTAAESNSITSRFGRLGIVNNAASDSQALMELKIKYCDEKKCLDCSLGNYLLGTGNKKFIAES